MKRILHFLSILLITYSVSLSQNPINFNYTDFTITPGEIIKSFSNSIASNTITKPAEGSNKTWDYRSLIQPGTEGNLSYVTNPKKGEFNNAQYLINSLYTLGNIPTSIITREYFNISSKGFEQLGLYHDSTFIKLDVTGASNVIVPFQKADFTPNIRGIYHYPFDISLPLEKFDLVRRSTNFFLNYPPFYVNAPANFMRSVVRTVQTVGWGNLQLVPSQKNSLPSVLLKVVEITVDSVYLNGAPAPEILMQNFGIVQGGSNTFTKYEYWSKGNNIPVLSLEYINNNANVNVVIKSDVFNSNTSVESENLIETIVSPNPSTNEMVKLSFNKESNNRWYLIICDETGKLVKSENIDESGTIEKQILLTNLANSKLIYSILNDNFKLVSSGSIINKK